MFCLRKSVYFALQLNIIVQKNIGFYQDEILSDKKKQDDAIYVKLLLVHGNVNEYIIPDKISTRWLCRIRL